MSKTKNMTKQDVLDMMPETNQEVVLQNILFSLSKTETQAILRVFNRLNTIVVYKTQLRALPFTDIHEALITANQLNTQQNEPME